VLRIVKLQKKKILKLRSFKRIHDQKLNDNGRIKRLQRCQQLLRRFPHGRSVHSIWFTDGKTFTVVTPGNYSEFSVPDKRVPSIDPSRLIRERQNFSKSVMVSVGVSKWEKHNLHLWNLVPR
jgi:hypothetical protein